ncbi:uncharacterized protein LOC106665937 isoform X1 [Cimex lectularius]|uniref:Uncharacterized protein n=1 Tax=Cimex lectularius TaxID=79782 RepID=A0A8I6RRJ1_CIMLE|nr:uncharacterized protein LOC106665937 isoform X1 [Cimex lectularius]
MFGLQLAKTSPVFNRSDFLVSNQQIVRNSHTGLDRFEPAQLSWQWSVKNSPDVQQCSANSLKPKQCPKKRFFPRFRKVYVRKDITSCDEEVPEKKPMTWKEYFSFLLPDEITMKPPLVMCRKMYEMRKQKCEEDWKKCGLCNPTEWHGQGVMHSICLTLPEPTDTPELRYCPPPEHIKPRCAVAKSADCPSSSSKETMSFFESFEYKVPFSSFKGGPNPPTAKQYIIKCNMKCAALPEVHEKSAKLQCKTYGQFKGVEYPKNMFTRFMSVDLPGGTLRPVVVSDPKPQREIKKGLCSRMILPEVRSSKRYHTTSIQLERNDCKQKSEMLIQSKNPISIMDHPEATMHLQPNRSALSVDILAKRAGVDLKTTRLKKILNKSKKTPTGNILLRKFNRENKQKPQEEPDKEPDKVKRVLDKKGESVKLVPKTPLERLMLIQDVKKKKRLRGADTCVKNEKSLNQSIEFFPYPVRKYHTKQYREEYNRPVLKLIQKGPGKNSENMMRSVSKNGRITFKTQLPAMVKYKSTLRKRLVDAGFYENKKPVKKPVELDCDKVADQTVKEVPVEVKPGGENKTYSIQETLRESCLMAKKKGVISGIASFFQIACGKKVQEM